MNLLFGLFRIKRADRDDLRGFKTRFFRNISRLSPLVFLKVLAAILFFSPWLMYSLAQSWFKLQRWKKIKVCKKFILRHQLAFEDIDESTLDVETISGGVSNANQIWRCKKKTGEAAKYHVKIFVPVGSFWAKHLSIVSPFPAIYGGQTHERFTVDMITRVQLAEKGISVPRLVAYDTVEKVMVAEYIEGESVDHILKRIAESNRYEGDDWEAVRLCGVGLAKVHKAGFSLIDTQPVNCIWDPKSKKLYFTDFEFCTRNDKRMWDVGFFLCYLALRLNGSIKQEVRKVFLESYQNERQLSLAKVAETSLQLKEYLPIFQTILDIRQFTPEELFAELLST